ncbi:hypothetical protein CE91St58_63770 [Lachnospiraceae bacterium]|nr:hypothetical protein CE91St58_63770 [Lachnospiraceae bacterium]
MWLPGAIIYHAEETNPIRQPHLPYGMPWAHRSARYISTWEPHSNTGRPPGQDIQAPSQPPQGDKAELPPQEGTTGNGTVRSQRNRRMISLMNVRSTRVSSV